MNDSHMHITLPPVVAVTSPVSGGQKPSGNFGFSIEALPASVIDVSKKVAMTNNEEEMLDFITVFVLVMCCSSCCCFRENLWDEQI